MRQSLSTLQSSKEDQLRQSLLPNVRISMSTIDNQIDVSLNDGSQERKSLSKTLVHEFTNRRKGSDVLTPPESPPNPGNASMMSHYSIESQKRTQRI
jgi:hypothetical protein